MLRSRPFSRRAATLALGALLCMVVGGCWAERLAFWRRWTSRTAAIRVVQAPSKPIFLQLAQREFGDKAPIAGTVEGLAPGEEVILTWVDEVGRVTGQWRVGYGGAVTPFRLPALNPLGRRHRLYALEPSPDFYVANAPPNPSVRVLNCLPFGFEGEPPAPADFWVMAEAGAFKSREAVHPLLARGINAAFVRGEDVLDAPAPPVSLFFESPEIESLRCRGFDEILRNYRKDRVWKSLMRRPAIFSEPAQEKAAKCIEDLWKRMARFPGTRAAAYSLGANPSMTQDAKSLDLDFSPETLDVFRGWIEKEYGTIQALNEQWGSQYKAWPQVRPETADECKARNNPKYSVRLADILRARDEKSAFALAEGERTPLGGENFSAWSDSRTFMDWALARMLGEYGDWLRGDDPLARVGVRGLNCPAVYGGHDPEKFARVLDGAFSYSTDLARDLFRDLGGPGTLTANELDGNDRDGEFRLRLAWMRGDLGVRLAGNVAPDALPQWLADASTEFNSGMTLLRDVCARDDAGVGIYVSQRSAQVLWMLDTDAAGSGWVGRDTSPAAGGSYAAALASWSAVLRDLGIPHRFVGPGDLVKGKLKNRLNVLILPRTVAFGDSERNALANLMLSTRLVVADSGAGTFDGHGRRREKGALDAVFGIERTRFDTLECDGQFTGDAKVHAMRMMDPAGGEPVGPTSSDLRVAEPFLRAAGGKPAGRAECRAAAMLIRPTRHGKARYLNLFVSDYVKLRETPESDFRMPTDVQQDNYVRMFGAPRGGEGIRWIVGSLMREAGVLPAVRVLEGSGKIARDFETAIYRDGPAAYAAIADLRAPVPAEEAGARPADPAAKKPDAEKKADGGKKPEALDGPRDVRVLRLQSAEPRWWYDVRSGKELGSGQSATIELRPRQMAFVSALPYRVEGVTAKVRNERNGDLTLAARVDVSDGTPGRHVLRLTVLDPRGEPSWAYSRSLTTQDGELLWRMRFALNDPPGAYVFRLRDVSSGVTTEVKAAKSVAAVKGPPAEVERPGPAAPAEVIPGGEPR